MESAPASPPALVIRGLSAPFGRPTVAATGFDFSVAYGEVLALVGPLGPELTARMEVVAGARECFDGEVHLGEVDVREDPAEARRRVGFAPRDPVFYETLSGFEWLVFAGRLREMKSTVLVPRAQEILTALGLVKRGADRIATWPASGRTALGLATALLHDPRILVLDDPLRHADPDLEATIIELLRGLAKAGRAVLTTAGFPDVASRYANRLALHDGDRILGVGPAGEGEGWRDPELRARVTALRSEAGGADRAARLIRMLDGGVVAP